MGASAERVPGDGRRRPAPGDLRADDFGGAGERGEIVGALGHLHEGGDDIPKRIHGKRVLSIWSRWDIIMCTMRGMEGIFHINCLWEK